ncbi:MAG: holo-ACP synthase [Rhabdochlamydiaceae bacterium]|jgi:holo-[acyl-carrier protein] synthase
MMENKSLIKGLGNDIVEIARVRRLIQTHDKKALNRLFTPKEQLYCLNKKDPIPHFAGRFSAKEAITKALGCGIGKLISWQDIEILNDAEGKPEVLFSPAAKGRFDSPQILLSISHCNNYATAVAIWTTTVD